MLEHLRICELSTDVAVGYAGHLLAAMGAKATTIDSPEGTGENLPPFLSNGDSAVRVYLSAGKETLRDARAEDALAEANIVMLDRGSREAATEILARRPLPRYGRVVAICSPYGLSGPKRDWEACELTSFQSSGEGILTPSGLSYELFPDRPPTGVGRYMAGYQAGTTLALAALGMLRLSRRTGRAQLMEVSAQEAQLAMNNLAVMRAVDGVLETRATRGHRYGGVFRCGDGYVELLTLEQHQWLALVRMLGNPAWATDERFADPLSRGELGDEINRHLTEWMAARPVEDVIRAAKENGVPCGAIVPPAELPKSKALAHRRFFAPAGGDETRRDGAGSDERLVPGVAWMIGAAE